MSHLFQAFTHSPHSISTTLLHRARGWGLLCALMGSLLAGCASTGTNALDEVPLDQIRTQPMFEKWAFTRDTFTDTVRKCHPTASFSAAAMVDYLRDFPDYTQAAAIIYPNSTKRFVYLGNTGVCIPFSVNGYPIMAGEALARTANPVGVPPDITDDWYAQITRQLAITGRVKVAYASSANEAATLVSYWNDGYFRHLAINYSDEFKKKNEWDASKVDFVFTHPSMRGMSVIIRGATRSSGEKSKTYPLSDYRTRQFTEPPASSPLFRLPPARIPTPQQ